MKFIDEDVIIFVHCLKEEEEGGKEYFWEQIWEEREGRFRVET